MTCIHPLAQTILLVLGFVLALTVPAALFRMKRWGRRLGLSLSILAALSLIVLWLGSYSYSPLEFFDEQNLHNIGFSVTKQGRAIESVASGDIITLRAGSPTGIVVLSAVPSLRCHWKSLNGGTWDDAGSCDTVYEAPHAEYDILTVNVELACGFPSARGQIKVSILP